MKKITLEKEEGIAEIIDRMLEGDDDEIALVIPKGSALGRSVRNFHLLKREADAAGKLVVIESVDDTILAFAKQSELEASHPLWRGVRGAGGVSDIIPANGEDMELRQEGERSAPKKKKKKVEPVKLVVHEEEGEEAEVTLGEEGVETFEEKESRFFSKRSAPEMGDEDDDEEEGESRRGSRKVVWGVAVVVLILIVLGVITWSFGHAAIAIDLQKQPWNYTGSFAADKSVSSVNGTNGTIPAQIFTSQKNATQLFPASGSANVSLKAQGTLTVYNAYSSAPQDLVATTRFVTPDGKLFRLVANVTVPGAKVTNGNIVPSSIDTTVVADQSGTNYNVGPVAKLTIPGFQGTPKYDAFYGALASGTTGGFTGTRAVPTATDITNAKTKTTAALQANLTSDITTSYPNNFKILDGATNVQVTKLTVNTTTDSNGNFSIFGEASLQAIGFDESAFKNYLLSLAQAEEANSVFSDLNLNYGNVHADFTKGRVSFALTASGTLEQAFSVDDFKASIAGKSVSAARAAVSAVPGLANGKISVWPMWLWSIPSNTAKITVTAD